MIYAIDLQIAEVLILLLTLIVFIATIIQGFRVINLQQKELKEIASQNKVQNSFHINDLFDKKELRIPSIDKHKKLYSWFTDPKDFRWDLGRKETISRECVWGIIEDGNLRSLIDFLDYTVLLAEDGVIEFSICSLHFGEYMRHFKILFMLCDKETQEVLQKRYPTFFSSSFDILSDSFRTSHRQFDELPSRTTVDEMVKTIHESSFLLSKRGSNQ